MVSSWPLNSRFTTRRARRRAVSTMGGEISLPRVHGTVHTHWRPGPGRAVPMQSQRTCARRLRVQYDRTAQASSAEMTATLERTFSSSALPTDVRRRDTRPHGAVPVDDQRPTHDEIDAVPGPDRPHVVSGNSVDILQDTRPVTFGLLLPGTRSHPVAPSASDYHVNRRPKHHLQRRPRGHAKELAGLHISTWQANDIP
jgi:hypothetical protein